MQITSSILAKIQLVDSSGSSNYVGSTSNSLYVWGAQVEFASSYDQLLQDLVHRYIRTTGNASGFLGLRFGLSNAPDSVTLGFGTTTQALRWAGSDLERISNWYNKDAKQGIDTSRIDGNLITYSESFQTGAVWLTSNGVRISSNVITSPIGTLTADKLTEDSTDGRHVLTYDPNLFPAGYFNSSATLSVFVKSAGESRYLQLATRTVLGGREYVIFNPDTGTVTLPATSSVLKSAYMYPVGDGWFRCVIQIRDVTLTGFDSKFRLGLTTSTTYTGQGEYFGTPGVGLYIWGASLTRMPVETAYVATVGSQIITSSNLADDRDLVKIGSNNGFKTARDPLEPIKFLLNKDFQDTTTMLDSFSFGDNLTYYFHDQEFETLLIGSAEDRRSADLEPVTFINLKTAKAGADYAVSGTTVTAADTDRLFVGQRYGNQRFSGDPLENISYWANFDPTYKSTFVKYFDAVGANPLTAGAVNVGDAGVYGGGGIGLYSNALYNTEIQGGASAGSTNGVPIWYDTSVGAYIGSGGGSGGHFAFKPSGPTAGNLFTPVAPGGGGTGAQNGGNGLAVISYSSNNVIFSSAGTFAWTVPAGVSSINVQAIGGGAGQFFSNYLPWNHPQTQYGGGGGGFAGNYAVPVTAGQTIYVSVVGYNTSNTDTASWINTAGVNSQPTTSANGVVAQSAVWNAGGGTNAVQHGQVKFIGGEGGNGSVQVLTTSGPPSGTTTFYGCWSGGGGAAAGPDGNGGGGASAAGSGFPTTSGGGGGANGGVNGGIVGNNRVGGNPGVVSLPAYGNSEVTAGADPLGLRVSGSDLENINFWIAKLLADETTMLDSTNLGDRLTYDYQMVANAGVDYVIEGYKSIGYLARDPIFDANQIQEINNANNKGFYNQSWYSLVPTFDRLSSVEEFYSYPVSAADYDQVVAFDAIYYSLIQFRALEDFLETESRIFLETFFLRNFEEASVIADQPANYFIKQLFETRFVNRDVTADANHLNELFYNTETLVDPSVSVYGGTNVFYQAADWYRLVPRTDVAQFAYGIGDGDGPEILDFIKTDFAIGKNPFDFLLVGTGLGYRTTNNSQENVAMFVNVSAKRGADRVITFDNSLNQTTDAARIAEIFANGAAWYQLAPYYDVYDHIIDTAADVDNIRVGTQQTGIKTSNNNFETIDVRLTLAAKAGADYAVSGTTVTASDPDRLFVGQQYGDQRFSGDPLELLSYQHLKTAKQAASEINTVVRTNRVLNSENLTKSSWATTGSVVSIATVDFSPELPFRSVIYDAAQISEFFYNTRDKNYYNKNWYSIVPVTTRTAFTSNAVSRVTQTTANTQHGISTTLDYLPENDKYFNCSIFVSNESGVDLIRLDAGDIDSVPHYADFSISSGTVVTSVNVHFAGIIPIDTSLGWYRCQIMGPVVGLTT